MLIIITKVSTKRDINGNPRILAHVQYVQHVPEPRLRDCGTYACQYSTSELVRLLSPTYTVVTSQLEAEVQPAIFNWLKEDKFDLSRLPSVNQLLECN